MTCAKYDEINFKEGEWCLSERSAFRLTIFSTFLYFFYLISPGYFFILYNSYLVCSN